MLAIQPLDTSSTALRKRESEKKAEEAAELEAAVEQTPPREQATLPEQAPPPVTKADLESGLQGSLEVVPESTEKSQECLEPPASLTGTFAPDKNPTPQQDPPDAEVAPVQPVDEKQPTYYINEPPKKQMFFLRQAACIIVFAVAIDMVALAMPWWEYENSETKHKVEMSLWNLKTSSPGVGATSVTWGEYCLGEAPPTECDDGKRNTVIALSFVGVFFASLAAVMFVRSRDVGTGRNWPKVLGFASLSLSIIFTVVSGQGSTWYPNNTRLKTPSYGFQLRGLSVCLMLIASGTGLAGECSASEKDV